MSEQFESLWSYCTDANRMVSERDGELAVLEQRREQTRALNLQLK